MNLKLRSKFLLSFTLIIMLTVLMISSVNYYVSVKAIKQNTVNFSGYLIEQIGINLEKRTKEVEDHVFQTFRNSTMNAPPNKPTTDPSDQVTKNNLSEFALNLLQSKDYFLSVTVIDNVGNTYSYESWTTVHTGNYLKNVDTSAIQKKRGKAIWVPGNNETIFMEKAVYDVLTNSYVGIIIVGVESSFISSIYTNVDELTKGNIIILNENNEPLILNRLVSEPPQYFLHNKMYDDNLNHGRGFQFGGETYISTIIMTAYEKWKVIQVIAVKELTQGTDVIKFWTTSTIFVSLIIAFFLVALITKSVTDNVRMLLQGMTNFSMDFTHKMIVPRSRDEVGLLAEKFNSMADKINELINSIYEEKLLKQKAEYRTLQFEYKALQTQINPHFLYNTLESIHSMAKLDGERQIGKMIYLLGNLLRESISKEGDVIYLHEEVAYIQNYLSIYKIIYAEKIEINYHFDPTMMQCMVPKFILQPLIENSIKHGIEEKPGKGIVSISCWMNDNDLFLEVADNGIGIDDDTKAQLLNPTEHSKMKQKDKHTKVGVMSVHKRIQILYGEQYGLTITSERNRGTSILIRLPIILEGEFE